MGGTRDGGSVPALGSGTRFWQGLGAAGALVFPTGGGVFKATELGAGLAKVSSEVGLDPLKILKTP